MDSSLTLRMLEFSAFSDAMDAQKGHDSELAQVLIAASYLDNQLLNILKSFMIAAGRKLEEKLFEGPMAPMGSFSARTLIAFSLGLIDERERASIDAIRGVRNQFAHQITTSFDHKKMTKHFDKLAWVAGQDRTGNLDRSELLFLAAIRLGTSFLNRADHVALERRVTKVWPSHRIDADPDPDYDPVDAIY